MARKFLHIFAILIVLTLAVLVGLKMYAEDLTELAFVPSAEFSAQSRLPENAFIDPAMWVARPDFGAKNLARWQPQGMPPESGPAIDAAVFFVHPTGQVSRESWNASLTDAASRDRAALFVKGMASPFGRAAEVWAPRYRQAAIGAFLTDAPEATKALDLAYGDVQQAFDYFISRVDPDRPIVLAGHSQGAFLLRRLMRDRVAGTPLARRVIAAYAIGWPISLEHDLPAMGLPACTAPDQAGCVMSWLTFADPAETDMLLRAYARRPGLDGKPVENSPFLCTNPLNGGMPGLADAKANLGTLVPDARMQEGELTPGVVPAVCGQDHFLHIGAPPDLKLGSYVLPGNNYHLYDIPLFWANLRADFARRAQIWKTGPVATLP